ncbi:MAG: hypothetical protein J7J31_09500 [Helicobacteraceae bacterium]|nr:hypothetical protein [Helicobacteraceae bacterium]
MDQNINKILYVVLGCALAISLYFNFTSSPTPVDDVALKFSDLPKNVQVQYRPQEDVATLKEALADLSSQKQKLLQQLDEMTQNEYMQEKELLSTKAHMVDDFAKCYTMNMGSYIIYYECKKNILDYIEKHKDAKYFEIIGIVDDAEFTLFKNLEENDFIYEKLGVSKHGIEKLKKLSQTGLAKHRSIEASWVIKSHTKQEAITYNAQYHLVSKEGKRGFIVRAYK